MSDQSPILKDQETSPAEESKEASSPHSPSEAMADTKSQDHNTTPSEYAQDETSTNSDNVTPQKSQAGPAGNDEVKEKRVKLSIFSGDFFNLGSTCGTKFLPDVLFHKDDFPNVKAGDVIQVYHPHTTNHENTSAEDDFKPRVLLKVDEQSIYPDNGVCNPLKKDTVYLDRAVADMFGMQNFQDVVVSKVNQETSRWGIALDSAVLTFKEQYLGRSDMWRLKTRLVDTCVYINKHIEFCHGDTLRCQVNELWANGERVASGLINSDTKIVFRSQSAMVYLFIQMSSEMWMHDKNGYLYFEKTVEGFLREMFQRWNQCGSSHEVTVVLFTRVFYDATSREEFPKRMLECIQIGYDGSFYEDFYQVLVQGSPSIEKSDGDGTSVVLKKRRNRTFYTETRLNNGVQ